MTRGLSLVAAIGRKVAGGKRMASISSRETVATQESVRGICPVCGQPAHFHGFTDNPRESGTCSVCGCFNRQRQMASVIRSQFGMSEQGSLTFPEGFHLFNTESSGALHTVLSAHMGYVCSEYFGPQHASGEYIEGVQHQDLQALSFADGQFDLVLSSDVLEHMPEPYRAHSEIYRVLKPGGRHIFTVPFMPNSLVDDVRAAQVDGEIRYFGERLYHGDPVRPGEGILVWTIFGQEMLRRLAEIGFAPSSLNLHVPHQGIIGGGQIVFEALKPEESQ